MATTYDVAIIGGGIVGLATAMELTRQCPGFRVLLLEKESALASHQTGHNSGVIHSGIYYRPGSLKARFCVQGAAEMIRFCRAHDVPHEVCGKLIVATSQEQRSSLEDLRGRAVENGLIGVQLLATEQLREIEPHATGIAALLVPQTGITSYRSVALKFAEAATAAGAEIATSSEVLAIRRCEQDFVLETRMGDYACRFLINCAGLQSDRIARLTGIELPLRIVPFRGEYFEISCSRRDLVRNLIYPVPDPRFPFLGVHFTRRITGEVEAGPNAVLAFDREGYRKSDFRAADIADQLRFPGFWRMAARYWKTGVGEMRRSFSKGAFTKALQSLVPEITENDLTNGSSGVRAQAVDRTGKLIDDFKFLRQDRALHVCNVPSPAATASLPISRHIVDTATRDFGWPTRARQSPNVCTLNSSE
jgi:(S)-2-hydroxyglutarate dehydrogenase